MSNKEKEIKFPEKKLSVPPPSVTTELPDENANKSSTTSHRLWAYLDLHERPVPIISETIERLVKSPMKGPHAWLQAVRLTDFAVVRFPEVRLVEIEGRNDAEGKEETTNEQHQPKQGGPSTQIGETIPSV